ncbi:fluoride efflux transporter CrcB [Motilibacter aurantiacus]|uniref:fluoride efflux transporter CrcB n=1 Tax=Motilibacter aurantiacus TaxID=2714955 RepID=UPI00140A8F96|nr:fluoride efflux transporter CrcB [Motilibacter aurantiacus]NHC43705.1 fluoride efflux transporter CrcB [Motilibacter aurantiacus]
MTALLVALGAAVGAPARFLVDRAVQRRLGTAFPWGTLLVNVAACLVLGALTSLAADGHAGSRVVALVGPGFCGALSTYSTFGYEALRLTEEGHAARALLYVVASVVAGLAAAVAGWGAGAAVG